jgi:L-threonylcarbamoyladenylate synthase
VIVADMRQLQKICVLSELARFLADEFYPVGFTLVLPKLAALPAIVTAGKDSVAVRIQAHPVASAIVSLLGHGVVGTSANLHHSKSPISGDRVRAQLGDKVDLIVDGECPGGIESTIVDVTSGKPVILRQGAVSFKRIDEAWERYCRLT